MYINIYNFFTEDSVANKETNKRIMKFRQFSLSGTDEPDTELYKIRWK